jgi:hypothetical protein
MKQPSHPSYAVTSRPPGPKPDRKPTLQHSFGHIVEPYTNDNGDIAPVSYKRTINSIHTKAVADVRGKREVNRVLGFQAPVVNPKKQSLPRVTRMTLRQLRSEHCKNLITYKHKLNSAVDANCPGCSLSLHTVAHLFACPAAPTHFKPLDMWTRPHESVEFLVSPPLLLPASFGPTLPRPPPEPPPPEGRGLVGFPLCGAWALLP